YGAEIISINDQPAKNVRDTVEVLFGDSNPATLECKRMNQDRLVGRAPVGKSMKIKFRNRGSADPVETTIVAVDDHYESFDKTTMGFVEPGPIVSYKILDPEKYGYLKMTDMGTDSASRAEHYQTFREAITEFNNAGSRGMILDLRVNRGGYDMLAAVLSGFFQTDTSLYEYNYLYDYDSHSFSINPYPVPHFKPANLGTYFNPNYPDGALFIEPSGQTFSKPVMVLVSPRAVSSGEGLPMILKRNPGNKIIGFHGTNGSFGILIGIPGIDQYYFFPSRSDMYIRFPWALSADKNLKVQIDSDSTMTGGVTPNILIPMTDSIMDLMYVDSIDVELNRAIQELNSLQGIGENATGSQDVILDQNYPNPAGENTVITFCLKQPSDVSLTVQDLYGRRVQTLLSGFQKPGKHSVTWETKGLASGLYIYKLQAAGRIVSRKMILR
ncbi:MAG: S41 family peptidase, partial [Bacteroidota bacterium]|nr:S41 family peptidase [Bacteroidota bacterium]